MATVNIKLTSTATIEREVYDKTTKTMKKVMGKTGFFYVTKKNPKNNKPKMERKKFDPIVRKHVIFKEEKI